MEPLHATSRESTPPADNPGDGVPPRQQKHKRPIQMMIFGFLAALIGAMSYEASFLWNEWRQLRSEWDRDARTRVIGFTEITPNFNFARAPDDWFHDEGEHSVLWARWNRDDKKHEWFHVQRGDLDPSRLSHSIGRDTVRVIDIPRVETGEGEVWSRIPEDHMVAGLSIDGVHLAYPFGVLDKVLIVNDAIPEGALLVVYAPFLPSERAVNAFNPVLNSERLKMGHTGYLFDGQPLLYDRKTESLWVAAKAGLIALAGPLRGATLARVPKLDAVEWGTWRSNHPDTRLVIGSTRVRSLAKN